MAIAAAVTVAAVVRLGLQARRDEIEIMELVGAPMTFIRGPFVAEGFLQGGLGAAVALLLLWAGFAVARGWWGDAMAAALDGTALEFLPLRMRTCWSGGWRWARRAGSPRRGMRGLQMWRRRDRRDTKLTDLREAG
jgi:hypothetical protein